MFYSLLFTFFTVSYASVIGIDYGTDWFKVAIIKPGPSIETVLNKESKRKTASVILIKGEQRYYGSDAVSLSTRYPQDTYATVKYVVGKSFDDPICVDYRKTFQNTMVPDGTRGLVAFKQNETMTWTVEALVGMQLAHAQQQAEIHGQEPVHGAVITVPPYFNHFERQVILDAAELAGIKVLDLINDETAGNSLSSSMKQMTYNVKVALSFSIGQKDSEFSPPQYHILYDMGAGSTVASLVKFTFVNSTSKSSGQTYLDVDTISMGYDSSLGGRSFDLKLQNILIDKFLSTSGKGTSKETILSNIRTMAKFLREANRVKQILSANIETFASIENVFDGLDFKSKITRQELEEASADLFSRAGIPVQSVIKDANLSLSNISSLVLVGGSVRIPAVQSVLNELVGAEKIARNVDGDEAAVLGAVYHAAAISAQFRTRRTFRIKDISDKEIHLKYFSGIFFTFYSFHRI